jgi:hypothetical protein
MGGFGFHDLFIEQGIHQVTALVEHLRENKSNTGNMLKIELDGCHLQAGTADHLLEKSFHSHRLHRDMLDHVYSRFPTHVQRAPGVHGTLSSSTAV